MACGEDRGLGPAPEIAVAMEDGTRMEFPDDAPLYVWCGPWAADVPVQAAHVVCGEHSYRWELTAVIADVVIGQPLAFPNDFVWDQPTGASIFLTDGHNELSTAGHDSSGTITFQQLDCAGSIEFTIDAVIDSEFGDLQSATMKGRFEAPFGAAPY